MKSTGNTYEIVGKTECQQCHCELSIIRLDAPWSDDGYKEHKPDLCDDCMEIVEREAAEMEWKRRRQEIIDNYSRYASERGLPLRYQKADFDNMMDLDDDNKDSIEMALKFLHGGGFFYLHGAAGRGKTWIAAAIVRELILRDRAVKFIFCVEMLNEIRDGFRDKNTINKALQEYKHWDWLVIDDLGAEKRTDWVGESIYDIINYRHAWMKPTVITSNMPLSKLSEIFGARLASRIKEYDMVVEVKGKDRRIK